MGVGALKVRGKDFWICYSKFHSLRSNLLMTTFVKVHLFLGAGRKDEIIQSLLHRSQNVIVRNKTCFNVRKIVKLNISINTYLSNMLYEPLSSLEQIM